jgi:beta-lactamase class A
MRRGTVMGTYTKVVILMLVSLLVSPAVAEESCESPPLINTEKLAELFAASEFDPGPDFKALVVAISDTPRCGLRYRYYGYKNTAGHRDNWWPASTVKIFAAVSALSRLREWKFSPAAEVTFHYTDEKLGEVSMTVEDVVRKALTPSDNTAYDRLVEIGGYEWLNDWILSDEYTLGSTVLLRGYSGRHRYADSGRGSLRHNPKITITEGKRTKVIKEFTSKKTYNCPNQGNCTSMRDLTEIMRRVILHKRIPLEERFPLTKSELKLLKSALSGKRKRGMNVVDGLKEAFAGRSLEIYSKPGFAKDWFSDTVFFKDTKSGRMWLVAMANRPGRKSCDKAARQLGKILFNGQLNSN